MTQAFRLEGQVFGEAQHPVAEAQVFLEPGRRTATTDADGKFAFEGLEPRQFSLSAHKDDRYAYPLVVRPEDSDPILLRLRLGVSLVVRAAADHAPVVGAKLVLDNTLSARTDKDGIAVIRGLGPRSHHAWLFTDGYADECLFFSVHDDPGGVIEHALTLHRGAPIEGVVIGSDNEAVSGVRLFMCREHDGVATYDASSDADGKWLIVARAGAYWIRAQSSDRRYADVRVECDGCTPQRDVVVQLGPAIQMVPAASITNPENRLLTGEVPTRIAGVVVDQTGQPVIGAHIAISEPSQRGRSIQIDRWRGETDGRGRFDVDGLEAAEYDANVRWPQSQRQHDPPPHHRVRTGDTNVRIALASGAKVSGRVLLDGSPLPYYGVSITPQRVLGGMPIGIRAADGRFTLPHVDPGTWQIGVIGPGTRLKIVDQISVADGSDVDLGDIAMERGQRITGHVRDRAGAPIKNARVIIGYWGNIGDQVRSRLQQWFLRHYETTTDAEGAYEFDGVAAHVEGVRAPQIWAEHMSAGDSLIRGLSAADTTIDFTLLGSGHIEGVIEGLRGGLVMALAARADEPEHARMATVGKDARFRFDHVPPGDYVVRLRLPDAEQVTPATVTVVAGQTAKATLVMSTSSISLTVIVPPGRSKELLIEPTSADAGVNGKIRSTMAMGTEDRCKFDFVRPGDYRLSLDGTTWTAITVSSSPEQQTIDLRKP